MRRRFAYSNSIKKTFHYLYGNGTYGVKDNVSSQAITYYSDTASKYLNSVFPTISFWFRLCSDNSYGCLLKLLGNWSGFAIGFGDFESKSAEIKILREMISWDSTGKYITDTNWHQCTITFVGSSTSVYTAYTVYIDGESIYKKSSAQTKSYPRSSSTDGGNDLPFGGVIRLLGYHPYNTTNSEEYNRIAVDCAIARVVLWSSVLTQSQILADYEKGVDDIPNDKTGISHLYTMSNVKDGIIYDEVGDWDMSQNLTEVMS